MKNNFEIVVENEGRAESDVKARLSMWPERLYSEQELKDLTKSRCLPDSYKDTAFYARLAVIREKSDRGFLSPKFKACQSPECRERLARDYSIEIETDPEFLEGETKMWKSYERLF